MLFPGLVFLGVALLEWRRAAVCARVALASATVFLLCAFSYPGASTIDLVEEPSGGLAYLAVVARLTGACTVLFSCITSAREAVGSSW